MGRRVYAACATVLCCVLSVLYFPSLKLGALGGGQVTEVARSSQFDMKVADLESSLAANQLQLQACQAKIQISQKQVEDLSAQLAVCRSQLARADQAGATSADPIVQIDMHKLLGTEQYYGGVSFDTHRCGIPAAQIDGTITDTQLQQLIHTLNQQMAEAMAKVLGKPSVALNTSWLFELRHSNDTREDAAHRMVRDPRTEQWRKALTGVLSRWMVGFNKSPALLCLESPKSPALADLGKDLCPSLSALETVQQIGYHAVPHVELNIIANDALKWGVCTKPPAFAGSYGQWLRDERMFNSEWKTYNVPKPEQDAVVLLYDVLYESLGVFKKQYWLGTIAMQHPFDFLSIADIIHTVRPDLIIETGTANGGSALMWASMMHLCGLDTGRVLSLDLAPPVWDNRTTHWGGIPRSDATQHPLWKKHVTFIKGNSAHKEVVDQVYQVAKQAKSVLVLLDSNHEWLHVESELKLYCGLVTLGSYCVVEDMKLSRWSSNGPLKAVKRFLAVNSQFQMDRERELVFTHHAMGYLKRIKHSA